MFDGSLQSCISHLPTPKWWMVTNKYVFLFLECKEVCYMYEYHDLHHYIPRRSYVLHWIQHKFHRSKFGKELNIWIEESLGFFQND